MGRETGTGAEGGTTGPGAPLARSKSKDLKANLTGKWATNVEIAVTPVSCDATPLSATPPIASFLLSPIVLSPFSYCPLSSLLLLSYFPYCPPSYLLPPAHLRYLPLFPISATMR
jgi:hypothetical protein